MIQKTIIIAAEGLKQSVGSEIPDGSFGALLSNIFNKIIGFFKNIFEHLTHLVHH